MFFKLIAELWSCTFIQLAPGLLLLLLPHTWCPYIYLFIFTLPPAPLFLFFLFLLFFWKNEPGAVALHPEQFGKFENENTENVKSKKHQKSEGKQLWKQSHQRCTCGGLLGHQPVQNNSENNSENTNVVVYWDTSPSKTTLKTTLKTLMRWFTGTPARPKQLWKQLICLSKLIWQSLSDKAYLTKLTRSFPLVNLK